MQQVRKVKFVIYPNALHIFEQETYVLIFAMKFKGTPLILGLQFLSTVIAYQLASNKGNSTSLLNTKSLIDNAYDFTFEGAKFAANSYCWLFGENKPLSEACPSKFCKTSNHLKLLKSGRTNIAYAIMEDTKNKRIIVSFKGTSSPNEWALDTNYRLTEYIPYVVKDEIATKEFIYRGWKVHRGFLKGYKTFHKNAMRYLLRLMARKKGYTLVFLGHSLGGALSVIAAVESHFCGLNPVIFTYGSPKVGNYRLIDWMSENFPLYITEQSLVSGKLIPRSFFRMTTSKDIVPLLPLYKQGFSHCGFHINIKNNLFFADKDDLELIGEFDKHLEFKEWRRRMKLLKKNYKEYMKSPMKGYQEFVESDYHRYYYIRMGCKQ